MLLFKDAALQTIGLGRRAVAINFGKVVSQRLSLSLTAAGSSCRIEWVSEVL